MIIIDKKFIARSRLRFQLGLGMIGMFVSLIGMLTFAKVWEDTFKFYNIPLLFVYIALPVGFFGACWLIGYLYDVKGIWKEESSHMNVNINPEFVVLCQNVVVLEEKLDKISKTLEGLNAVK
jgi:hypothetical protein